MLFGINKLSIRPFFPFVNCSLFRRIFDSCAAADVLSIGLDTTADPETATSPARHDVRFRSCFKRGSLLPSRSGSIFARAEEHLAFARRERRVALLQSSTFGSLHLASDRPHPERRSSISGPTRHRLRPARSPRPSWKHVISPEAEIPYADFVIEAWIANDPASGGRSDAAIPTIRPAVNLWTSRRR
jgi:hypothetical protein